MLNKAAAKLLEGFADALEIRGANAFRVRAFRNAARQVDALTSDLSDLVNSGEIKNIKGIGKGIAGVLQEFVANQRVEEYDTMRAEIPAGVFEMLKVPGLGPKTVATLYNEHGITSLDALETAGRSGQLADIKAVGPKRQEKLLRELGRFRERTARHLIGEALPLAELLVEHLRAEPQVMEVEYAGSLRRGQETIGDLDILASSVNPDAVMEHFITADVVDDVIGFGSTKTTVLINNGIQVDLLVVEPPEYGAALMYFTGSKDHNIEIRSRAQARGLSLNEHGILDEETGTRHPAATEQEIYAAIGLPWIEPTLRENRGEIEAADAHTIPQLIVRDDIKGELHGHSLWSDGAAPIADMLEAAKSQNLEYFSITDHSGSLGVANGLDPERLAEQTKEISAGRTTSGSITLLHGSEVEILTDGNLDFSDEILASLDVVVASIHSSFNQSVEQMTTRMITAIEHPHVDIIGHPTGRILGRRDGYEFDVEAVMNAAAATGTALEINASPERLDLNDVMARRAAELGVPISINSDAHHPDSLGFMHYGILTAQRAWLRPADVLNTLPVEELLDWLRQPKPRRWIPH
ncbi:MAG: DNA polymerase III [Chloroflexi bacterium]|nr:DNA polymerase III [Chloroflexota bacterium]HCU72272.1 DNA polymerase III [Chloroflexota bacterium]